QALKERNETLIKGNKMFIKLENLNVHYKVAGAGAPVILLHGWGCNIDYFAKLQAYLAKKFTVYAIDLPGFGLSTTPEKIWGSAEYANLIEQFINDLKIVNPILLGHSLGGKIIINLVAHGLVEIKKIILISSSGIQLPKSLKTKVRIYFFKLLKFLVKLPIIKIILGPRMELYRKKFGSNDYKNASGIMREILVKTVNENVITLLPKIKIPVLLLWGDQDTMTTAGAGQIMQLAILGSKLKIFTGSGHFPFLDNWEKVAMELDNFLG
ncbi:MAG TPA: alpha/beta hydrolase, partial [Coxiellaceae bacterium]|nr:alpha/beta hydrolase [Coxiellaceae bacterium]